MTALGARPSRVGPLAGTAAGACNLRPARVRPVLGPVLSRIDGSQRLSLWRIAAVALLFAACSRGPVPPATLDPRNDACSNCRMTVSDVHFAAQLVAPGEEPRFFDDIGCLRDYLAAHPASPSGTLAYVGDHRTGEWVLAANAVYTQGPSIQAPMGSHLMAHVNAASRDLDSASGGTQALSADGVFGPSGLPRAPPSQESR